MHSCPLARQRALVLAAYYRLHADGLFTTADVPPLPPPASPVAADHALQQHSPSVRAFSLLMAATGLGFGLGPVIGAVVPPLTAYRAAAALALLAAGLTYASGEEGAEKRKKGKGKKEQKGLLTGGQAWVL